MISRKNYVTVKMENKVAVSNTQSANRLSWKPGKNCKINIYKGDTRNKTTYSGEDFAWVAAHEFGHVLGLADQGNYTQNTIMGAFKENLKSKDVENVLNAFIKKKFNGGG